MGEINAHPDHAVSAGLLDLPLHWDHHLWDLFLVEGWFG